MTSLTCWTRALVSLSLLALAACAKQAPPPPPQQALPVQTQTISAAPVPQYDEYVSTIKSRRSATITPQVDGNLVKIYVHSGERVRAGQLLMEIDPAKQEATVSSSKATEQQKLAVFQYNQIEVERQKKLFEQGVTSRDALDQAEQAYKNSQADYQSSVASTQSQNKQLGYYRIAAPFPGIVGDVPVHLGDYVGSTTVLTTVDENRDLEAYIYIPTERGNADPQRPASGDSRQPGECAGKHQDRLCFPPGGQRSCRAFWPRHRCMPIWENCVTCNRLRRGSSGPPRPSRSCPCWR